MYIYNFTDNVHMNKIVQDKLWNEISAEMETSDQLKIKQFKQNNFTYIMNT